MSEISKYESYKKKLEGLCDEHNMVFRLRKDKYPFKLTIRPADGLDAQMSLLEREDKDNFTSPDATITFSMVDGVLVYRMSKTFTIGDALFGRFKSLFKNLYASYTGFFFQDVMERDLLRGRAAPVIDESDEEDPADKADDEDEAGAGDAGGAGEDDPDDGAEDLDADEVATATSLVRQENKASVSFLQRAMKIGYAKAARIMDKMEKNGVVGPFGGSTREVLPYDEPEDAKIPGLGDNKEVPGDDEA